MIAETVARISPLVPAPRLWLLTGEALAEPILAELPELSHENLLVEPVARGTAPVLAWAAHEIARRDPDAVMISLHADHDIEPDDAFRELLAHLAGLAARLPYLFTVGVTPNRPETGYGYIRVGERLDDAPEVRRVAAFVEKPDRRTAEAYLRQGGHLWNSGIFVWRVRTFLDELGRHTPELAQLLPLLEEGDVRGFFDRAPSLSVDEGLLERSDRVAVAPATFRWDDVGAWEAVGRARRTDGAGNVAVGDAHLVDTGGCIVWAEEGSVVVFGAQDLVVVRTKDVTFVAPRDRTPDLKALLERLPDRLRRLES